MFKYKVKYNIAIVGATGIVGEGLLNILKSRDFPINEIVAIASKSCLLYTSPSPRDQRGSRMPSSA